MKISIITVTFNSARFIRYCIESVLRQDYPDIEYIVIDGASSDNTVNIIKSFGDKINHFISEPDKGIYDAINKGIDIATGNVIGILNSDDFFADDNVVTRIARTFGKDANIDALYADVVFVDQSEQQKTVRYYSSAGFKSWMFRFGFQPAHPTFYCKKEVFEREGLYRTDLKIAGDFELLMRFMLKNRIKVEYVTDVCVKMRTGGVSTNGFSSIARLNAEIMTACRSNGVYTNLILIYSKYMFKWWSFLKAKLQ